MYNNYIIHYDVNTTMNMPAEVQFLSWLLTYYDKHEINVEIFDIVWSHYVKWHGDNCFEFNGPKQSTARQAIASLAH